MKPATASSWSREQAADFWQENYHSGDNAVDINAKYPVVENIVTHNTGNVAFADETKCITVRDVYVQHADDDAAESDTIVGARFIRNSMIRLFGTTGYTPDIRGGGSPGYNQVFKWEKDCEYASKLEVRKTIRGR